MVKWCWWKTKDKKWNGYKDGGKVKKTGFSKVHQGLNLFQQKKLLKCLDF